MKYCRFALGIAAKTPQRSEELQRIARPRESGERPNKEFETKAPAL